MDHTLWKNEFCLVTATSLINNIFHFMSYPGHLKYLGLERESGTWDAYDSETEDLEQSSFLIPGTKEL